jgi:hypothetical protein
MLQFMERRDTSIDEGAKMKSRGPTTFLAIMLSAAALIFARVPPLSAMKPSTRPATPPGYAVGRTPVAGPFVILQAGDTTWVQVHVDGSHCPGDPAGGHGGEGTGGPGGIETWCFESDWPWGDSCGTYAPWDIKCFKHHDVRALPSQVDVNYWHVSSHRTDQRSYCGDSALWCGSDSLWNGSPVECGAWVTPPGYGDQWNCIAQLTLPETFDVANGCTLLFDPRYDTECKYDYLYLELYDGTKWEAFGVFNATSNNPGDPCGGSGPNPDHWGNTDTNRLTQCNWQTRTETGVPAFKAGIDASQYSYTSGPIFRWRFASDNSWSDADGNVDTDGAAFIDNVGVYGDDERYEIDFESGLDSYWSFPDPEGVTDQWHMTWDPDPPYEGGDGGDRSTCTIDSSIVYRGRPEGGYPVGTPWRNRWFYRLTTPAIPIQETGCVIQYDQYICALEYTCDYTNSVVRFFDTPSGTWCPWIDIDGFAENGGCFFWDFDRNEDVTAFYSASDESVQFGFDLLDVSQPGDFCGGKHYRTDHLIDNVSVGYFDGSATAFYARSIDMLQDMYFTDLCAYNSFFAAYDQDTLNYYSGEAHPYPKYQQFVVEVIDKDYVQAVTLFGTIDEGATWINVAMTQSEPLDPEEPDLGGQYYATLCPSTFGLAEWDAGTEAWYYVRCTDQSSNEAYFPAEADPGHADHTGLSADYFEFSILPMYPESFSESKILLVDGFTRTAFDYAECFATAENRVPLKDIYARTLADAGYCFDRYDISGAGANEHIHYLCTWNTDYDAVIWVTGPYNSNYLFDKEAMVEMRNYLAAGGKIVICGDRAAYHVAPESEGGGGYDSLGGEFMSGIMGCDYLSEMDSPFVKPYVYCEGVPTINVFSTPTPLGLDTMAIYRDCPYLKDMSWVKTETSPPGGYVTQALLSVINPDVADADMAIYSEYQSSGQSVFIDFDLSASVNHQYGYCDGHAPSGYEDFDAGRYEGRVDLLLTVLEDIFGLASGGSGTGGTSDIPAGSTFRWALHQSAPNPAAGACEVRYEVARTGAVSIRVYNTLGQHVTTLVDGPVEPGRYTARWDGRNFAGESVSSGVYFYKMTAPEYTATKKMLLVR